MRAMLQVGLGCRRQQWQVKSPVEQRSRVGEPLCLARAVHDNADELMTVASSREYQAETSFRRCAGLDASRAFEHAEQCVGGFPGIPVMIYVGWQRVGLRLYNLSKGG